MQNCQLKTQSQSYNQKSIPRIDIKCNQLLLQGTKPKVVQFLSRFHKVSLYLEVHYSSLGLPWTPSHNLLSIFNCRSQNLQFNSITLDLEEQVKSMSKVKVHHKGKSQSYTSIRPTLSTHPKGSFQRQCKNSNSNPLLPVIANNGKVLLLLSSQ